MFDSVRRRLSFSPSTSRTSTPIMRPNSSSSRLSIEEIDEILESPFETNYTYSESAAYKPHIGSREYVHPRLCRRFPSPHQMGPSTPVLPLIGHNKWRYWSRLAHGCAPWLFIYLPLFVLLLWTGSLILGNAKSALQNTGLANDPTHRPSDQHASAHLANPSDASLPPADSTSNVAYFLVNFGSPFNSISERIVRIAHAIGSAVGSRVSASVAFIGQLINKSLQAPLCCFEWIGSIMKKIGNFVNETADSEKAMGRFFNALWWPIEKAYFGVSFILEIILSILSPIWLLLSEAVRGIWRQLQAMNREQPVPNAGGAVPNEQALEQKVRAMVESAIAGERALAERRMRRWEQQQQRTGIENVHTLVAEGEEAKTASEERVQKWLREQMAEVLESELRLGEERLRGRIQSAQEHLEKRVNIWAEQMQTEMARLDAQIAAELAERQKAEAKCGQSDAVRVLLEGRKVVPLVDESALLEKARQMVRRELRRFDADRTGIPDFALESAGGSVLSTRLTLNYNERSRTQKLFGIPLWYSSYSPRTVIQRKGYGASAGECWAFYTGHGYLAIGLSKRINVTSVSYEHLPVELSPEGHIHSAPKQFLVWSYQEFDVRETRMLLGNFTYNAEEGEPLQVFRVQHWDPRGTPIVELETLSNWGAPVTCLYRFRVHGQVEKAAKPMDFEGAHSAEFGESENAGQEQDDDVL